MYCELLLPAFCPRQSYRLGSLLYSPARTRPEPLCWGMSSGNAGPRAISSAALGSVILESSDIESTEGTSGSHRGCKPAKAPPYISGGDCSPVQPSYAGLVTGMLSAMAACARPLRGKAQTALPGLSSMQGKLVPATYGYMAYIWSTCANLGSFTRILEAE